MIARLNAVWGSGSVRQGDNNRAMIRRWTKEWGFSQEAIEAALELTAKGDPSMGYLDGILNGLRQEASLTPDRIMQSSRKTEGFREVLRELGKGEVSTRSLQLYDRMLALYPQEIILMAARECGHNGKDAEDILKLLESWKEKGLETQADTEQYVKAFHDQTGLIRQMKKTWGTDETRISKEDRSLVQKWETEMGFSQDVILTAAEYASEAKKPMIYLNSILTDYRSRGISTAEQVRLDHETNKGSSRKPAKPMPAQNFPQRSYENVPEQMRQDLEKEMQAFMNKNGGESDA